VKLPAYAIPVIMLIFPCVQQLLLVLFPQDISVLKPNFDIFAEIHQKEMLKVHVAVWHQTYF